MSGPSLQRLRVFVAVVDTGGVGAAARSLDLAQSTVSTQLRALEAELGSRLVDRDGGAGTAVVPTAAGQTLLESARAILATYADAVTRLQQLGQGPVRGPLAIAGTATAGEGVLPRLLVDYARRYPLVDIDLRIDHTAETLRRLDRGETGLVVAADAGATEHETVLVARERQVVIAPADHPLAGVGAGTVDPAVLHGSTVLVREPGSTTRAVQLELLERWSLPRPRVWTVSSTSAIVRAVAAGLGIACVTGSAADAALRLGEVSELALDPPPLTRPVHLLLRRGRPRTRAEEEFVALTLERTSP